MKKVVAGEEFRVPSDAARRAVRTAVKMMEWTAESEDNMKIFTDFASRLVRKFERCFVARKSMKMEEEFMWREYHTLRTSDAFKKDWESFLRSTIGEAALPTFFQFVSHETFKELVKAKFELPEGVKYQASQITKEEENALRYVSGYVCRKVQERIKHSALAHKEAMILFICDLSGDEWDEEQGTEEWTNAIDRGGLWHVSDSTYLIFYLMEEEIRKLLIADNAKTLNADTKMRLIDAVLSNEDLLFQWSLLTATLGDEVGNIILKKLADLYITIRGFAFASSCLELYKQQHKKRTQKSKALRKKLITE